MAFVLIGCVVGFLLGGIVGGAPFGPIGSLFGSLIGALSGAGIGVLLQLFVGHPAKRPPTPKPDEHFTKESSASAPSDESAH